MVALVDCNSFYCSCERVFNPALEGKAVVVLSNNDGCAIARNAQAKALGIPMGAPEFQWRERFRAWGVEVFSSNYALYGDLSRRVMEVLAGFTPSLEVYSIDEAFLGLPANWSAAQLHALGTEIRARVGQWIGLPVGVGIGATKTLAKLANRQAKQTGGVGVVEHGSEEGQALLEKWPVAEVWGVGGRLECRLGDELGIRTAGQLARAKPALLRQRFGVAVERTALELRGTPCSELIEETPDRKHLCCSRSFGRPVTDLEELRQTVATHAARAGEKLRAQGLAASAVAVFLYTNRHRPELPQHCPQAGRELLVPTSFTPELVGECLCILAAIHRPGHAYAKAGVLCLELVADEERQGSLFRAEDPVAAAKQRRLMAAADKLNLYYGRGTVRMAAAGCGGQPWQMRQARVSGRCTTRFEDLPVVNL